MTGAGTGGTVGGGGDTSAGGTSAGGAGTTGSNAGAGGTAGNEAGGIGGLGGSSPGGETDAGTAEGGGTGRVACVGWGATANVCKMETVGYVCNCPGYLGCLYKRFADTTCSDCSPYGCGDPAPNGTPYVPPVGDDPRPASCTCAIPTDGAGTTASLSGTWMLDETPGGATYGGTLSLEQSGSVLSGSVSWTVGPMADDREKVSSITGSVTDNLVTLNRLDTVGATVGLRAVFNGTIDVDGNSMIGIGANDPASPNGNNATYAWTAHR